MRRLRAGRDWSQEHLAFEVGLNRTYVSDMERSARNPFIEIIEKLFTAFEVTAGALQDWGGGKVEAVE